MFLLVISVCWMHYPQKTENKGFRRLNRRLTLMHLFIMLYLVNQYNLFRHLIYISTPVFMEPNFSLVQN